MTDSSEHEDKLGSTTRIIHLQLLPPHQEGSETMVSIAIGIKGSPPLVRVVPLQELVFPPIVEEMLAQLEAELPQRQEAINQRQSSQKENQLKSNYTKRHVSVPDTMTVPSPNSTVTQPSLF